MCICVYIYIYIIEAFMITYIILRVPIGEIGAL